MANGQSPKDRDVVEDDGDHLEDFTGLNSRGSVLDEEKFFFVKELEVATLIFSATDLGII